MLKYLQKQVKPLRESIMSSLHRWQNPASHMPSIPFLGSIADYYIYLVFSSYEQYFHLTMEDMQIQNKALGDALTILKILKSPT